MLYTLLYVNPFIEKFFSYVEIFLKRGMQRILESLITNIVVQ